MKVTKSRLIISTGVITSFLCILGFGLLMSTLNIFSKPHPSLAQKYDEIRKEDLKSIQFELGQFYKRENKLPENLNLLRLQSPKLTINDPESNKEYDYEPKENGNYQLCATFSTDTQNPNIPQYTAKNFTLHPQGKHCIELDIQTSLSETGAGSEKGYSFFNRKISALGLNKQYSLSNPKITSISTSAQSYYSELYSIDNKYTTKANFPDGFFTTNPNEWGLITLSPAPVSLTVVFKEPTKIKSITSDFTPGCGDLPCLEWSVFGKNSNDQNIMLYKGYGGNELTAPDKAEISDQDLFKQLEISVSITSSSKAGFLFWRKLNIEYK